MGKLKAQSVDGVVKSAQLTLFEMKLMIAFKGTKAEARDKCVKAEDEAKARGCTTKSVFLALKKRSDMMMKFRL